ncbi:MAG: DUF4255 domain-containing protein, partial [Lewinella sp.]|nr:DUF4255 domain-containing protein [Lewinella sp.]
LVKTEEEFALKNQAAHRRNPVNNNLELANPPIFLNLYVLVTANFNDYETALTMLGRVIGFFQWQRVFNENNAELPSGDGFFPVRNFHFNLSMVSPSLEQLNHLWGVAGGRMLPSVLYKLQLQEIEYVPDEIRPGNPITEIVVNEQIY